MRIVILGGGFGGLNAALLLGKKTQSSLCEIVLVSDTSRFVFRPSLIWVPFNNRQVEEISFPINKIAEKVGIRFIQKKVASILPKERKVLCQDGTQLVYDYLIIAAGAVPDWEKIEGLKGNTASVYDTHAALQTKIQVEKIQSGQPIIIGVAQQNPAQGPAYEFLFELHTFLHKRNIRCPITFFTYEKELLNHQGKRGSLILENHMKEKQISYYCDVSIAQVQPGCLQLSNGISFPYSFSLILPPYRGADFIFSSPDLAHENGLLPTNKTLQSTQWENIYVVGDANAMKKYKSGRAAEIQGKIAAGNILNRIKGNSQQEEYHADMLYLMELGTDGGLFVIRYPGSKTGKPYFEWAVDGYLPHLMKLAFERYYSWKLS
ncbi:NAD(P)/FAD-dependent oxidoreductase [Aneurinibacillus aneurinilyticus]|jgi:sulfide:quinone oxidoreductase|uniref:FAD-dependent oxidoreductase n=3 Tax=Aneurinibacillus aneurinilyticus TaxID=1391 RepID=A0A848D0I9_ANEAE|nr:FAD-dependent oxidoreductase [Aneurinibacillus aneurinilyticus]ERI08718.1 pyridine nucleotide-disulfide oxidoreductase [Aneurinibacillus aneurinilyticus ATCC 12856]MED0672636.1 FAD-dependent oxidoreductase [Aneurinibacillus aneurinilyticus]MED0708221.1 FAD-dependent oxidoreductase [Aneurinibacillus aneurinilyticus]MED0726285.1 FAD-dependent oxidoreductase [Aneurinibacillus aneurinilyticus]MED0735143.1 FAD-dependent oxidoreductase [Aneurinibacillus aneurinilyticus]